MATKKLNTNGLQKMSSVVTRAIVETRIPDAEIPLNKIDLQRQVRTKIRGLEEFAANIKVQGIKTPIILHVEPNGRYRLIAGERRYRAAEIAGLVAIPAVLERNLTEREIRAIQVAENNERENLTAYEQAVGVIEDVDKYGVKEAMVIWNRSEPWISKRVAVNKYDARITRLMDDEISDDLEMLQTLNHILILKPDDFLLLEQRMRNGSGVTREEARSKLAGIKSWLEEQEQLNNRRKQITKKEAEAAPPKAAGGHGESAAAVDVAPTTPQGRPAPAAASAPRPAPAYAPAGASSNAAADGDAHPAAGGEDKNRRQFQEHLLAIFANGRTGGELFGSLKMDLADLECTKDQTDWVLWSGFLTIALPLLTACGPERSASMLKRLQGELRQEGAERLWKALYPSASDRIAVMPENWRL